MLKLLDLTYHTNTEFDEPLKLLKAQKESLGYVNWIKDFLNVSVIKHMPHEHSLEIDGIRYKFLRGYNRFSYIPFRTHRYLKEQGPDVVMIQGFIFPLQVIFLRLYLGKKCLIILQHHGERPYTQPKRILQKLADKCINAYTFTSLGNSKDWIDEGVIPSVNKCYEIQAASTSFAKQDKEKSKIRCGVTGNYNFIWVGRLNTNKDPLTVLSGFEKHLDTYPEAKLYMIYQAEDLLMPVQSRISQSEKLKNSVILKGKIDHEELIYWYSAADFYISGSHKESCGFALIEAMACGCIPVVTDIPSFRKITGGGRYGYLYEPGKVDSLFDTLAGLKDVSRQEMSGSIIDHFQKELSFKSIADNIYLLCRRLAGK